MIKNLQQLSKQQFHLLVRLPLLLILALGNATGCLGAGFRGRQAAPDLVTPTLTSTPTLTPTETSLLFTDTPHQTAASTPSRIPTETWTPLPEILPPTVAPTETSLPLLVAIATATSTLPAVTEGVYTVGSQDTVVSIAAQHGLSADDLRAANAMSGDALLPGQRITLPTTTPVPVRPFRASIIEGDLVLVYPLSLQSGRFTLHYAPNTFPAQDPQSVYDMVSRSVDHIERLFQIRLSKTFDVYAFGSLVNPPNSHLRGKSDSSNLRVFFLDDGTGSALDQQYISAHELTHMFLYNTFGRPASTMLSEGAAVFSGMEGIAGADHLPLKTFCAAYNRAHSLPHVSVELSYSGHIYNLENYYTAGCFVGYLIEKYGLQSFGKLYHSGAFTATYGKTPPDLEQEWIASLKTVQLPPDLEPARLVKSVAKLEASYLYFMPSFNGTPIQLKAYYHLDLARLALLTGQLDDMQTELTKYQVALAGH